MRGNGRGGSRALGLRWAPRVAPDKIARLYKSDAAGMLDTGLLVDGRQSEARQLIMELAYGGDSDILANRGRWMDITRKTE
jgi:hypothetical protein